MLSESIVGLTDVAIGDPLESMLAKYVPKSPGSVPDDGVRTSAGTTVSGTTPSVPSACVTATPWPARAGDRVERRDDGSADHGGRSALHVLRPWSCVVADDGDGAHVVAERQRCGVVLQQYRSRRRDAGSEREMLLCRYDGIRVARVRMIEETDAEHRGEDAPHHVVELLVRDLRQRLGRRKAAPPSWKLSVPASIAARVADGEDRVRADEAGNPHVVLERAEKERVLTGVEPVDAGIGAHHGSHAVPPAPPP
jgi:hypothetical protein